MICDLRCYKLLVKQEKMDDNAMMFHRLNTYNIA